ncbi:MAG TPA: MFS transporter, partial [Acidimicrobiales bacterium]|nr:MFS transporter [Acidimicrobiales bacterium]
MKDRSVAFLLTSVFLSHTASMAQNVVLGKQVYDLTGRELDLGLLGLVEFAPAFLLVLLTGAVADRFDRRRVAALGAVGEACTAGALAWYAGTNPTSVGPIFLLVFGFGVARAFATPSARALPADIVSAARLPKVIVRFSGSWQVAMVIGPVLGGFLYAVDVRLPYLVVMVVLLGSAGALLGVGPAIPRASAGVVIDPALEAANEPGLPHAAVAPSPERPGLRDAVEGLRFIRHHPLLLGAISLDLFAVLFGGAVALLPAIAEDRLHVGAVGLGWLRAAGGLGAAATTVVLAVWPVTRKVGRTLLFVVAGFGAATIVLGLTRSFVLAFVAMAVLSGADAVSVFIRSTLVPLVTPHDKRGRVLAVENVFIGASNE